MTLLPALKLRLNRPTALVDLSGIKELRGVTRSGDTSVTSSVLWEVIPSGANPANTQDFGGVFQSGAVAFGIGETSKTITITVAGDNTGETAEGFSVVLNDAVTLGPCAVAHGSLSVTISATPPRARSA